MRLSVFFGLQSPAVQRSHLWAHPFTSCTLLILWDYCEVLARLVLQNPWCRTELPAGVRWQLCLPSSVRGGTRLWMGCPGPVAPSSSAPVPGGDEPLLSALSEDPAQRAIQLFESHQLQAQRKVRLRSVFSREAKQCWGKALPRGDPSALC